MPILTPPLHWPLDVLRPAQILPNVVPFSRTGGVSLGGIERVVRTDRGWWTIAYKGITLGSPAARRAWNSIRTKLAGRAGTLSVPVWSFDAMPWRSGAVHGHLLSTNSDDSAFSDGARWATRGNLVELATEAAIGDTSVTLRLVYGPADLSGIRFSYEHALYETGAATDIDGDEWTVPVFPAIRRAIPADAGLEVDMPRCLVRLASDAAMNTSFNVSRGDKVDVAFVEDVATWNDLA